jgi:hypothetical protein
VTIYSPKDFDPYSGFGEEISDDDGDVGMPAVAVVFAAILVPLLICWWLL